MLRPDGRGLLTPATPLVAAPGLARRACVAEVLVKMESERALGSFKSLGGTYAALQLISRHSGLPFDHVASGQAPKDGLPRLVCASDGNHGLAVAEGARAAGAAATIFLHHGVNPARSARIGAIGADIVWIRGTYDDAVDAARAAAAAGHGVLVPDTSDRLDDEAVGYVLEGYSVLSTEIAQQCAARGANPTHLFVQAGVGGLAAALAMGLAESFRPPPRLVVVEPEAAACVAHALRSNAVSPVAGDLATVAEMLSCGVASAPAVAVLQAHRASAMTVTEGQLSLAVDIVREELGVSTTASGAAGISGLLAVANDSEVRSHLGLTETSIVALILTE